MKGMKGMGTDYKKPIPKVLIYPDYLVYPCLPGFIPCIPFIPVKSAFVFWHVMLGAGVPQVPSPGFQHQTSNIKPQTQNSNLSRRRRESYTPHDPPKPIWTF